MKRLLLATLITATLSLTCMAVEIENLRVSTRQIGDTGNLPAKVAYHTSTADVLVDENFEAWVEGTNEDPYFDKEIASLNGHVEINPKFTHGSQWYGHKVFMAGGAVAMRTLSMDQAVLNTPRMDYSGSIKLTFRTRALVSEWEDEEENLMMDRSAHILVGLGDEQGRQFETNAKGTLVDLQLYADMGWVEVTVEFDNYSAFNGASFVFAGLRTLLIDDIKITSSSDEFIAVPVLKGVTNVREDAFTISWEKVRKSYNYYVWLYSCEGTDPETGEEIYEIVFPEQLLEALEANDMTVEEYIEGMGGADSPHLKYDMVQRDDVLSYTFRNLDPAKEYAYAVMSHNVFQFSKKVLHKMTIVPTPAVYEATDLTYGSFKANWSKVTKAASYDVDFYGVKVAPEDDEEYSLLYEGFDKTSDYFTPSDEGKALPCTSAMTLDDMTSTAGWSMDTPLAMEVPDMGEIPMAYMLDGWFGPAMGMTLSTPMVYVANNDYVNIRMRLRCANSAAPVILQFAGAMYMANMDGNTDVTAELTIPTNGLEETCLDLACRDGEGSPLFIDYISITQPVRKGDRIFTLLNTTNVADAATSLVFDEVDKLPYNTFAYAVSAVNSAGVKSAVSERKIVNFKPEAGVEAIEAGNNDILEVARYSIDGRRLQTPEAGINIIVYSDGTSKKVIVK